MGSKLAKLSEIKISNEYEKQISIPQPVLIYIFTHLELEDLSSLIFVCKQFFFLIQTDNFWKQFVSSYGFDVEKFENQDSNQKMTWKELYLEGLYWKKDASNSKFISYSGKIATHLKSYNLANVYSLLSFISGEENYLFVCEIRVDPSHNYGIGVSTLET